MAITVDFVCSHEGMATADVNLGARRYTTGGGGITTSNVRTGARAMILQSNNVQWKSGLSNSAIRYAAFSLYIGSITSLGARSCFFVWNDGSTAFGGSNSQVGLFINGDAAVATIAAYRGPTGLTGGGTLLGTSTLKVATGVQYDIVLATKFDGSAGVMQLWLNNVQYLNLSTLNTSASGNNYANAFGFGGNQSHTIDNVVICSETGGSIDAGAIAILKKIKVIGQVAEAGNGTNADSTPSSGSDRGAMMDETTGADGDTTHNEFTAVGDVDTYNFPAVGESGNVLAVQNLVVARKTDVDPRDISLVERISGTDYDILTAEALSATYQAHGSIRQTSPATAVGYSVSELDANEMGPKVAA